MSCNLTLGLLVFSHVHAAYASFLWEAEEYVDESVVPEEIQVMQSHFHGAVASASA